MFNKKCIYTTYSTNNAFISLEVHNKYHSLNGRKNSVNLYVKVQNFKSKILSSYMSLSFTKC